ncbi:FkbM family methyltransferase [Haliea sp. E1-2-M8]|uniref:FkbM family methyltransferase n=1 Tax=Haliea sp. E1-2-M8 TaxID=3064706 RepID=UPI00271BCB17|nr:FkbM family methyltransferase [Haliea sp. E1-2-M8]MDO8862503.1 FkbM family methyltransferase [Haliea sp. E1-2-M8]
MNWYRLKKRLLWPYICCRRWRERGQSGFMRAALELHYYRPTFYRFIAASIDNPDIMYEAPLEHGGIALDVGAYHGDWAARVYEKYQARIYAFEPDPPSIAFLRQRFAAVPNIRCLPFGLGGEDARLSMIQRGMGSTLYEVDTGAPQRTGGVEERVDVQVRDIVGLLDELGHADIDIIKLNIEGAEYALLERLMSAGRLGQIRVYTIQFHEWHSGAHSRRRRIQRELARTHDKVWDYPFVWEQWVRRQSARGLESAVPVPRA